MCKTTVIDISSTLALLLKLVMMGVFVDIWILYIFKRGYDRQTRELVWTRRVLFGGYREQSTSPIHSEVVVTSLWRLDIIKSYVIFDCYIAFV